MKIQFSVNRVFSFLKSKVHLVSIIFLLLNCSIVAHGEEYYVSPSGSASWSSCMDIGSPCSITTAMSEAQAGDTVYFRGGIYPGGESPSYHGYYEPSHSGTNGSPIIFSAYPGETPIIELTLPTVNHDEAIGTGDKHWITWDGFTLTATNNDSAGAFIGGNFNEVTSPRYGLVFQNITLIAGSNIVSRSDNGDLMRLEGTDGAVIRNCRVGGLRTDGYSDNNAALKFYHNTNAIIENNDFFNSPNGICVKSTTFGCTFRNNFIYGNYKGFRINVYLTQNNDDNKFYNNVIVNNSNYGFHVEIDNDGNQHNHRWNIYNNTFYNNGGSINIGERSNDNIIYNNIIPKGSFYNVETVRNDVTIAQMDHNQFTDGSFSVKLRYYENSATYTSLSSLQSSGELEGGGNPGVGSLASNPLFVNTSGNMNQLDDFRLASSSPSKGTGRGGVDMGANIDLVGVQGEVPPPPQKPTTVEDFILVE